MMDGQENYESKSNIPAFTVETGAAGAGRFLGIFIISICLTAAAVTLV